MSAKPTYEELVERVKESEMTRAIGSRLIPISINISKQISLTVCAPNVQKNIIQRSINICTQIKHRMAEPFYIGT